MTADDIEGSDPQERDLVTAAPVERRQQGRIGHASPTPKDTRRPLPCARDAEPLAHMTKCLTDAARGYARGENSGMPRRKDSGRSLIPIACRGTLTDRLPAEEQDRNCRRRTGFPPRDKAHPHTRDRSPYAKLPR